MYNSLSLNCPTNSIDLPQHSGTSGPWIQRGSRSCPGVLPSDPDDVALPLPGCDPARSGFLRAGTCGILAGFSTAGALNSPGVRTRTIHSLTPFTCYLNT